MGKLGEGFMGGEAREAGEGGRGAGQTPVDAIDAHVGRRLRQRRTELGMSRQQLGMRLGLSYQQIHKYEVGMNRVSPKVLWRAGQELGVEPGYFFEGIGTEDELAPRRRDRQTLPLLAIFGALGREERAALLALAKVMAGNRQRSDAEAA